MFFYPPLFLSTRPPPVRPVEIFSVWFITSILKIIWLILWPVITILKFIFKKLRKLWYYLYYYVAKYTKYCFDDYDDDDDDLKKPLLSHDQGNLKFMCRNCNKWIIQDTFTNFCDECLNRKTSSKHGKYSFSKSGKNNAGGKKTYYYGNEKSLLHVPSVHTLSSKSTNSNRKFQHGRNSIVRRKLFTNSKRNQRKDIKLKRKSAKRLSRQHTFLKNSNFTSQSRIRAIERSLWSSQSKLSSNTTIRPEKSQSQNAMTKSGTDISQFNQLKTSCRLMYNRIILKLKLKQRYCDNDLLSDKRKHCDNKNNRLVKYQERKQKVRRFKRSSYRNIRFIPFISRNDAVLPCYQRLTEVVDNDNLRRKSIYKTKKRSKRGNPFYIGLDPKHMNGNNNGTNINNKNNNGHNTRQRNKTILPV